MSWQNWRNRVSWFLPNKHMPHPSHIHIHTYKCFTGNHRIHPLLLDNYYSMWLSLILWNVLIMPQIFPSINNYVKRGSCIKKLTAWYVDCKSVGDSHISVKPGLALQISHDFWYLTLGSGLTLTAVTLVSSTPLLALSGYVYSHQI